MDLEKAATALSKPVTKLLKTVSSAIGKVYEPYYHRKMTDANVYRIEQYSKAIRDNSDVPIVYDGNEVKLNNLENYEALLKRAGSRLAYQEISKQENIETIVDKACDEIKDQVVQTNEEVSPEWINRYINMAGEISTEQMQDLWAKVLAGEVIKPNSYSLKTLECLRNMSVADALLFERISGFIISDSYLFNDKGLNSKYGISYDDILNLDDCGLINSSGLISLRKQSSNEKQILIDFFDYVLLFCSDKSQLISINNFPLTRAGKELLRVVKKNRINTDYMKDFIKIIQDRNKNVSFSLFEVAARVGDKVLCEDKEISIDDFIKGF